MRQAMEQVAGRAETLAKDKTKEAIPPPFRKRVTRGVKELDWDPKTYTEGKESRDERNRKRTIKVFGMEQLGLDEYQKLMREIDSMTGSAELDKIVRKRIKEVKERLENERLAREAEAKRKTRSQTEAGTSKDPVPPVPETGSPRKRKRQEETVRKEIGGKAPKKTEPDVKKAKKSEVSERKQTAEKRPKPKTTTTTTTSKTPRAPQHVDDEDYELDVRTGRFVRKEKEKGPAKETNVQKDDESVSRRKKIAGAIEKTVDTGDASRNRKKKKTVTFTEEEANDDDLEIVDDEDLDKDYEPGEDDYNDDEDDENYQAIGEDLDDFEIPPLRQRTKPKEVVSKKKSKSTQRRVATTDEGIGDETLSLFQRIVGDSFEVRATEEFEEESKEKRDRCLNPVEAAGFRATMKTLALEVKKAVRKGKNIRETYTDMVSSTIRIAKAMKYPGAAQVTTEDILPAIKDIECNAWRKHLEGKTKMNPEDLYDEEEEEHPADDDLLIQQNMLGKESTDAAAAAIEKLPKMIVKDVNNKLHKLFGEIEKAHRHAAEATKTLRELHEDVPLDVFLRIADATVRPLVILHIPKTAALVQKLTEAGVERMQRLIKGSDNVIDVMLQKNLPVCGDWSTEEEFRPKKMIAALIHKYLRDAMLKEATATQTIVDEFKLAKTTIHRQIWGKKYPGGGQKVDTRGPEASGSGSKRVAAVILKRSEATEALIEKTAEVAKKGKGKGKSSSGKSRTAADIRKESTAEDQKRKRRNRPVIPEDEDPDLPTQAEIAASKPASKGIFMH